jgi:hypothetical protein
MAEGILAHQDLDAGGRSGKLERGLKGEKGVGTVAVTRGG